MWAKQWHKPSPSHHHFLGGIQTLPSHGWSMALFYPHNTTFFLFTSKKNGIYGYWPIVTVDFMEHLSINGWFEGTPILGNLHIVSLYRGLLWVRWWWNNVYMDVRPLTKCIYSYWPMAISGILMGDLLWLNIHIILSIIYYYIVSTVYIFIIYKIDNR